LWFDGRCGFCTRWADWLESKSDAEVRPWQAGGFGRNGLRMEQVRDAAFWVAPDGTTHGAHVAIARALRSCGGVLGWLGRLMTWGPLRRLARFGYRLVARHRNLLPGTIPACQSGRC
jgi:predicted DCC family thiol-disulfide oxidoreductase YuxK